MTSGKVQEQQNVNDKQTLASSQLKKIQQISNGKDGTTQAGTFIFTVALQEKKIRLVRNYNKDNNNHDADNNSNDDDNHHYYSND